RENKKEGNVALYKEHFGPLWYSFDYKWAHFVVLFSDEQLAFSKPAKTQNVGPEQLAWLKEDLKETRAEQIFVFLHHPRWHYRGTNWPDVHALLAKDGRVRAVFAGHLHVYRDDGERNGIHYYTIAVTGGSATALKTPAALHHICYVKLTREAYTMSVMPAGAVMGADMVLGPEVDRLYALRAGTWLRTEGRIPCHFDQERESEIGALLVNPAKTVVDFELRFEVPKGWTVEPAFLGGSLQPGEKILPTFKIKAAPFDGRRPAPRLQATLHHPLRSGLIHPVHHSRTIPVRIKGAPTAAARKNGVLVLDGKSALRVNAPVTAESLTVECWVRGGEPKGSQALISKTEQSGFGLWWCYRKRKYPYGVVSLQESGYQNAEAREPWEWGKWTHLAFTCGKEKIRLFVNGMLVAEGGREGSRNRNLYPIFIGADPDRRTRPGHFFTGAIDEVRLSSVVRYKNRFRPLRTFKRDDQTLLLLHLDQEVKGLYPDDSGNELHAWPLGKPAIAIEKR
ncbi:MAG: LamG-like jellyroll fold domain-containing protein, partial [Planctomycetota bacterium]